MKKFFYLFLAVTTAGFVSCSDDDDNVSVDDDGVIIVDYTGESKTYTLDERAVDGISGVAIFRELTDGSTEVTLDIEGTPADGLHPAHIHAGTALEGGDIVVTFNPVNGSTGESVTIVSGLNTDDDDDDDESITYDQLLEFDGYINVHLSADELGTIVAQGDIGENELSGSSKVYTLEERDVDGVSGTATFEERNNGETLVTIDLEGTPAGGMHPAHIHAGNALDGGAIVVTFNPVDGDTGRSVTNVSGLNLDDDDEDDESITYEQLLAYDGYINVHLSMDDLGTLVAQGDIGSNELTGDSEEYDLDSVDVDDISGTVTFAKRADGSSLVSIQLENTPEGGEHPAHIHMGSVDEAPGAIIVTLASVDGDTGFGAKNISQLNNGESLSYEQLIEIDGYVNVHFSAEDLATLVAQGNVGENADD